MIAASSPRAMAFAYVSASSGSCCRAVSGLAPLPWSGTGPEDEPSAGADINARGDTGETPLGTAVRLKMDKAAAYLRAKGARQ